MPKKDFVKLKCEKCGRINYFAHKSKQQGKEDGKLELKKFCKWCKTHTPHKEGKK